MSRSTSSGHQPSTRSHSSSAKRWTIRALLLAGAGLAIGNFALALKPARITPQGEVSRVREFVVQFDQAATTTGNPNAPAQ